MTNWLLQGTPLTPTIWEGVMPLLAGRGHVAAPINLLVVSSTA